MKYPSMGSNPRNAVSIPALSGGVNFADALNLVDDNQMTDCKNVWYKDGVLQTRPGITTKFINDVMTDGQRISGIYDDVLEIDGVDYTACVFGEYGDPYLKILFVPEILDIKNENQETILVTWDFYNSTNKTVPFKNFVFYNGKSTIGSGKGVYLLATFDDNTIGLYELTYLKGSNKPYKFESLMIDVNNDLIYQPLVYVNGKGESYAELPNAGDFAPASFFEGHNAITGAFSRYCYTTDSESTFYRIPDEIDNIIFNIQYTTTTGVVYQSLNYRVENGKLKATAEDNKGESKPTVDADGNGELIDAATKEKLYFWVNAKTNSFKFLNSSKVDSPLDNAVGVITNNLVFRIKPLIPGKSILAGATKSNKFGGVSEGIYGGTRIFLTGFSGENKNLLVWSDLNKPTYFSENSYNHIGSSNKPITALAKQDDMLVIYKEKELFYATYVTGEGYSADDVLSGRVMDVTTLDAKFPVTQIHNEIGCDLPNTVKLCGNRLVWANSDGKVYMLRSANQYSMTNISVISNMLGDGFHVDSRSKDYVSATTYQGFYLLKSSNKVYLMNYDQYYFNALPSYSDTKKANRKMQWFIWETPEKETFFSEFIANLNFPTLIATDQYNYRFFLQLKENVFEDSLWERQEVEQGGVHVEVIAPIESVIQTKMFDFNAMDRFKSIEQMYVGFGEVVGETAVQYLTDRGTLDRGTIEINATGDMQSPEFIKTKRFLPGIKRALRFGVRFTAKGRVAISGVLIKYKYMGVTR